MNRILPTREFREALETYTEQVQLAVRTYAQDQAQTGACVCCGATDLIQSRGLISRCYRREVRAGTINQFPRRDR